MVKIIFVIIFAISALLITGILVNNNSVERLEPLPQFSTPPLGSDRDQYGCITSAGYSWCEQKNKCLRTWEEDCSVKK